MSSGDIAILASLTVLAVAVVAFIAASRFPRATNQADTRYLMDQLMNERETAKVLRVELDALKSEVVQLRGENALLRLQVNDLFERIRTPGKPSTPTPGAARFKPGAASLVDDDLAFRDWLVRHFDADELTVLAADAGMPKPVSAPVEVMATALVQSSRRIGTHEALQREAMARRENVPAW